LTPFVATLELYGLLLVFQIKTSAHTLRNKDLGLSVGGEMTRFLAGHRPGENVAARRGGARNLPVSEKDAIFCIPILPLAAAGRQFNSFRIGKTMPFFAIQCIGLQKMASFSLTDLSP
jgi:hypothetical protein